MHVETAHLCVCRTVITEHFLENYFNKRLGMLKFSTITTTAMPVDDRSSDMDACDINETLNIAFKIS